MWPWWCWGMCRSLSLIHILTSEADFQAVEQAITEATAEYDDGKTAICFMGHGTEAASNAVYETLQDQLTQSGHENYYIGTVEAEPSLDTVLSAVQKGTYERVILVPLMIVAGAVSYTHLDVYKRQENSRKRVGRML